MWLMLQQNKADDYVVATGRTTSVREMCRIAFDAAQLRMEDYVVTRSQHLRPAEVDRLLGDPSKAKSKLGWKAKTTLEEMIQEMVDSDLRRIRERNS